MRRTLSTVALTLILGAPALQGGFLDDRPSPAFGVTEAPSADKGVVVLRLATDTPVAPGFNEIQLRRHRDGEPGLLQHGEYEPQPIRLWPVRPLQGGTTLYWGQLKPGSYRLEDGVNTGGTDARGRDANILFPLHPGGAGTFEVKAGRLTDLGVLALVNDGVGEAFFTTGWELPSEEPELLAPYPKLQPLLKAGPALGWTSFQPKPAIQAWARSVPATLNQPTWTPDGRLVAGGRFGVVPIRDRQGRWSVGDLRGLWEVLQVAPVGDRTLVALLESGQVSRSEDGGRTWKRLASPAPGCPVLGLEATAQGWRAYAYRNDALVVLTCGNLDEGAWKEGATVAYPKATRPWPGIRAARTLRASDAARTAFAFVDGAVFVFDHAKGAWSRLPDLPQYPLDLLLDPAGTVTALVAKRPFHGPAAFREGPQGLVEVPSLAPLRHVTFLPGGQVVATQDRKVTGHVADNVMLSTDGGQTWHEQAQLMSGVNWIIASPKGDELLLETLQGDILESRDLGRTWKAECAVVAAKLRVSGAPPKAAR